MREKYLWLRENGVYWLRAIIKGRKYRESLRTTDVKQARKLRDKRLEEIRAARYHNEVRITWKDAVVRWSAHAQKQISAKTMQRYLCSIELATPILGSYTIDKIDGRAIVELISFRSKQKASPATIRRDLTAISQVLEYSEFMEWREGNPTLSKRRQLKERRDPIELPQHDAIEKIIAEASLMFGNMIRAAWLTGCRQNELVTARWSAFNETAGTLEVIGKGNKRRTISLAPEMVELLKSMPRTLRSDLIFCVDGAPISQAASDFTHLRREATKNAKARGEELQRFRFHDLRHLYAVEALRGGMGIYQLSQHLGHTSVKTTEIYLAFLTPEQQAATKLGEDTFGDTSTRQHDKSGKISA
jgi:integrase/recombinase XerD